MRSPGRALSQDGMLHLRKDRMKTGIEQCSFAMAFCACTLAERWELHEESFVVWNASLSS